MIKLNQNKEQFASIPKKNNERATENLKYFSSKNITRLDESDPVELAVMTSQLIWPATHEESRPGAIILSAVDSWQLTLASADLIHHPNNGPILLIDNDSIPQATLDEINRLQPKGNSEGTQVKVMGNVSEKVLESLEDYKIDQITDDNPASFAAEIDRFYAEVSGELPENVIIVSSDDKAKDYSIIATYWIAHMPEPVLFVTEEEIPESTKEAIKKRENPTMYILGPSSVVSRQVEEELKELGKVKRIEGENPSEASIAFTQFKDEESGFGWGITDPGHGLSFVSSETPNFALVTAPLAHLGKHAPLLFLDKGEMSENMGRYLAKVKPTFEKSPMEGPYNHGFIIGSLGDISYSLQGIIDNKLEIEQKDGGGHH
ncbi:cell wall-binding repeat-containing protein [Thalassobacillus cyri]|nr:cell wall-binding repeat-containing protein [Thalassobacillus cyri]